MAMSTRALVRTVAPRQRSLRSVSTRSFTNDSGSNDDDGKSSLSKTDRSSQIVGKRPGQTPFSPPTTGKTQSTSTNSSMTKSIKTTSSRGGMPLVSPPNVYYETSSTASPASEFDNREFAHARPTIPSLMSIDELDEEDNALRRQLLREGILPPTPKLRINDPLPNLEDALYELDPSGVSRADPEDVLDMASMYDPAIHLPDKPNFNSSRNRLKYELGTPLTDELVAYIGVRGPITVAEYMRRALRDGRYGYYTGKGSRSGKSSRRKKITGTTGGAAADDDDDWEDDSNSNDEEYVPVFTTDKHVGGEHVIGSGGDFITAPEVSQLFGESLLVWFMTQYRTLNGPSDIQFVEIGPGKGTLICDILRSAISTFPDFASALKSSSVDGGGGDGQGGRSRGMCPAVGVHLVEVTNGMRARQKESLISLAKEDIVVKNGYTFRFADDSIDDGMEVAVQAVEPDPSSSSSTASSSSSDANDEKLDEICVSWHDTLSSVPTHDAVTDRPIPTFVICQELVDALPIHSFQKIDGGVWRERLVDVAIRDDSEASEAADKVRSAVVRRYANAEVDETNNVTLASSVPSSSNSPDTSTPEPMKKIPRLRFVLPPDTTPAIRSLLRVDGRGSPLQDNPAAAALDSLPVGSIIEACPEGLLMVQDIADRIVKCNGGAALIVDYGGDGSSGGDTLRGFWKHAQVHPLSRPGEVDVTADVDFGALREAVNSRMTLEQSLDRKIRKERRYKKETSGDAMTKVVPDESSETLTPALLPQAFGPTSQGKFLAQMGIVQRVEKKIEDPETTDEQAFEIYSAMERLIVAEQMGERYKVMAIAPKKDGLFPPPGF